MIIVVDDRLRREAREHALRFGCEHCHAFDSDAVACAYGYPTEPHRGVNLEEARELVPCKAFEVA